MHRDKHEWLEGHHGEKVGGLIKEDQEKELRKLRRKYIIVGSRRRLHGEG
jgi:hypothetical protein